jgi:hypothetical protein
MKGLPIPVTLELKVSYGKEEEFRREALIKFSPSDEFSREEQLVFSVGSKYVILRRDGKDVAYERMKDFVDCDKGKKLMGKGIIRTLEYVPSNIVGLDVVGEE